jgi:hypothetical protein
MDRGENIRRTNNVFQELKQDALVRLWDQYSNDDLQSKILLEKVATLYDDYNKAEELLSNCIRLGNRCLFRLDLFFFLLVFRFLAQIRVLCLQN